MLYYCFKMIVLQIFFFVFLELSDSYGTDFVLLFLSNPPNTDDVQILISTPEDSPVSVRITAPQTSDPVIDRFVTVE